MALSRFQASVLVALAVFNLVTAIVVLGAILMAPKTTRARMECETPARAATHRTGARVRPGPDALSSAR